MTKSRPFNFEKNGCIIKEFHVVNALGILGDLDYCCFSNSLYFGYRFEFVDYGTFTTYNKEVKNKLKISLT